MSPLLIYIFGAGGIRTPDTLSGYNSLAGSPIRPLSHRSKKCRITCKLCGCILRLAKKRIRVNGLGDNCRQSLNYT